MKREPAQSKNYNQAENCFCHFSTLKKSERKKKYSKFSVFLPEKIDTQREVGQCWVSFNMTL